MRNIYCVALCLLAFQAIANPTDPIIKITPNAGSPTAVTQTLGVGTIHTQRICTGQQIKLEAIATGVGTLAYQWIFVQNGTVVSNLPVFTSNLPEGQYHVKVTDNNGITTSTTLIQICIETAPPINTTVTSNGASTLCASGGAPDIILTAQASNPAGSIACPFPDFKYEWYKDNVLISGATSSTFVLGQQMSNAGVYTARVYNACGFDFASFTIGIADSPPVEVSIYTDDASNVLCPSGSVILRATTIGVVDSYQWFKQGLPTPIGIGNSLTVNTIGTYFVKAKNGCGEKDSPTFTVVSATAPTQVNLSAGSNFLCEGGTVLLAPIGLAGGTPAQISYFKDGELIYNTSFPFPNGLTYDATQIGTYTVKIANKCGEVTSAPQVITSSTEANEVTLDLTATPPSLGCGITEVILGMQANGTTQFTQWYKDNIELAGENNPTLSVFSAGTYFAEVFSDCGVFYTEVVEVINVTDPPVSNITLSSNTVTCAGKITLQATPSGAGNSYQWFKEGVPIANTAQNSYEATATGTYTVQANNACGSSNISNAQAIVVKQGAIKPIIDAPAGSYICGTTGTVPLRMTSADIAGVQYQWLKDGLPIVGATTANYQATSSGLYALRAETPLNDCIAQTSESIEVRFITAPTLANLSILLNICENPVTLRVLSDGNFLQYRWFFLNGTTNPEVSNSATFTPTVSGAYTLSVRNDCLPVGVWLTANPVNVTVGTGGSIPAPTVVSEPVGIDRICPNTTLKLKAQVTGVIPNVAYRWFLGDEMMAGETAQELIVSASGLYRAEVYDTQNPACGQVSSPYSVFVRPTPTLLLTYSPSLTFCEGDSVRLNANAQQIPTAFSWTLGVNSFPNGNVLYAKEGGDYQVKAIYNAGTLSFPCDFTAMQTISTTMLASPIPEITTKGGLLESKVTAQNYQWNYNGIPILGANSPFYMPLDSGRYTLTITNNLGCSGTSTFLYHAGIYEGVTNPLQIAPNPNAGSFRVTVLGEEATALVQVFNAQGQLILPASPALRVNSLASHTSLEFRDLATGVYLVQATVGDKRYARKVVVY